MSDNDPLNDGQRRDMSVAFCAKADDTLARIHSGQLRGVVVINIGSDISERRALDIIHRIQAITGEGG